MWLSFVLILTPMSQSKEQIWEEKDIDNSCYPKLSPTYFLQFWKIHSFAIEYART